MRTAVSLFFVGIAACGHPPADPAFRASPMPEPLPFEPASPSAAPDPSRPGPFPVGVRTVTFEDPRRPKDDGTPRLLVTEIWYPAVEAARSQPGETYDLRPLLTDAQRKKTEGLEVPLLATFAVRDAKARTDRRPYPLVIFSHGQGGIRWQSTYYTVLLASHGYVVASPDHEGNTIADALRGHLSPGIAGFVDRPKDVSFLIDRFSRLKDGDPLKGAPDLSRVGVTGHSFGAITTLRAAADDPRVKAIVPQAPAAAGYAWLGLPTPVKLGIPVLVQAGHADRTLPWDENVAPTWSLLERPRFLLDVTAGGHFTFSDLCRFDLARVSDILDLKLSKILRDGCGPEAPAPDVAQPLIGHFAVGFFNVFLRESPGSRDLLTQAATDRFGAGVAVFTGDP
jgi:predicted dienelactone hydrolase